MMKKVFTGLFWGMPIWLVLTFLAGAVWGMLHNPTVLESSIYDDLILLPPSLLLGVVLVTYGQTQFLKRSLLSIILGLVLWLPFGTLLAFLIRLTIVPREASVRYLHVFNPILVLITVVASFLFISKIYPRFWKEGKLEVDVDRSKALQVANS